MGGDSEETRLRTGHQGACCQNWFTCRSRGSNFNVVQSHLTQLELMVTFCHLKDDFGLSSSLPKVSTAQRG